MTNKRTYQEEADVKSIALLTAIMAISINVNASTMVEDFNDPFPAWESGWLGNNSNIQNFYGVGDPRPGDYLWIDDGDGIRGAGETVEIAFDEAFGLSLTSFSIDIDTYISDTSIQVYDGSGDIILDFGFTVDLGFENISVLSANGISGFSLTNSNLFQIEGSTTIDNVVVTTSAVPLPATLWLFVSGLTGLVGAARRKTRA
jgi:hypothetical protein